MDGLSEGEYRTIFLDWALGMPTEVDTRSAVRALIAKHAAAGPDHPMMVILQAALIDTRSSRRLGGRRARRLD